MTGTALNVERHGDWQVAVLRGDLDVVAAGPARDGLLALVAQGGPVAVDCSELGLVDSSGLRALVAANNAAAAGGEPLVLVGVSLRMRRLLEITKLSEVMDVRPSVADLGR